ncbi:MAG: hypothetical protein P794_01805 [Epsilonproteobacteria bacterium (ex Lamellibrachia satsuma)]|nr:MAG: hypothetical protein P794_01805 [Epsilonproteobacteria bacterium (ex Lamellibrachia satsuma)]
MDASSKSYIETVSRHCYSQLTYYQFNTSTLKVSEQYRAGRLSALKYVSELTFRYLQEEKRLREEFRQKLIEQMKLHTALQDGEYKNGLYDGLNEMLNVKS